MFTESSSLSSFEEKFCEDIIQGNRTHQSRVQDTSETLRNLWRGNGVVKLLDCIWILMTYRDEINWRISEKV